MVPSEETTTNIVPHRSATEWLAHGPIAPFVDAFKKYLTDRGYAAVTFTKYVHAVAHFAHWADRQRLGLDRIDEASIVQFLDEHLPDCRCPRPAFRTRGDVSAALGHLLVVLRSLGAIAPPLVQRTPVDEELGRYDAYMQRVRGLEPKTRSTALRIVGRMLRARFGAGDVHIGAIKPQNVRAHCSRLDCRHKACKCKLVTTAYSWAEAGSAGASTWVGCAVELRTPLSLRHTAYRESLMHAV